MWRPTHHGGDGRRPKWPGDRIILPVHCYKKELYVPMTGHHLACPRCGQVDRVEKLSVVVQAGSSTTGVAGRTTSTGFMAGERGGGMIDMSGQTTLSGGSRTVLSQRLAPPPRPTYDRTPYAKSVAWSAVAIVIGLWFFVDNGLHGAGYGFVAIGLIICALAVRSAVRAWRADKARRALLGEALPQWARQVDLWNRTFYCQRDDVVFLPDTGEAGSADDLQAFLYAYAHA